MVLVDEHVDKDSGVLMKFYFGLDFQMALSHPKDGSDGMMLCFVDNYIDSKKSYERERKINNILQNIEFEDFEIDQINNSYVYIYQTGGYQNEVYEAIKKKIISTHNSPVIIDPISEYKGGLYIPSGEELNGFQTKTHR